MHQAIVQSDGQFNLHIQSPFQSNPHYILLFTYRETRLNEFIVAFSYTLHEFFKYEFYLSLVLCYLNVFSHYALHLFRGSSTFLNRGDL